MSGEELLIVDVVLEAEKAEQKEAQKAALAKALKLPAFRIKGWRLLKRSLDARQKVVYEQMRFEVSLREVLEPAALPVCSYKALPQGAPRVIIVGAGPAGLFAALRCLEYGVCPVVLERGKDVSARRFDLAPIMREGRVVEDSNYCFGEGGAGTFSDGKLYTRAKKRGPVREIFETFVAHGAPAEILIEAHPHIGSNLLPNVVKAMRMSILAAGGEVHFGAKVVEILRTGASVRGVRTATGKEYLSSAVILATGHSARDVYRMLHLEGIALEQKAFAMGVRLEHSQAFIDGRQYHLLEGQKRPDYLPAARYSVATKIRGRGVHSFCMCPGGFIVPAATENDEHVVNGMSLSRRDSPFANAGFVVTVEPEDTRGYSAQHGVLAGVAMQKDLEQKALLLGGGGQKAPAQRAGDFLRGKLSSSLPETSYFPGLSSAPLHEFLPAFIAQRMAEGLREFERKISGYAGQEALMLGLESRTSSPVRIPRREDTLCHPELVGLYPAGEGAGYAGGIASAALDGRRCSEAACAALGKGRLAD